MKDWEEEALKLRGKVRNRDRTIKKYRGIFGEIYDLITNPSGSAGGKIEIIKQKLKLVRKK